jgi:hypothetical protein
MDNVAEKENAVKVEFWTERKEIAEFAFPYPAQNMAHDWLKSMPSYISGGVPTDRPDICLADKVNRTMKTCPGINDMLGLGYIVPLWTDIIVSYDCFAGTIDVKCFDEKTEFHFHRYQQFEKCPVNKTVSPYKMVLNLHSPWMIKLPSGYSSYICHPFWSETDELFSLMPGIVDNDSFHTLNLIMRWNKLGKGEALLKAGTPVAQIFPFRREKFQMSILNGLESRPDTLAEHQAFGGFFRKYRSVVWKKKSFS